MRATNIEARRNPDGSIDLRFSTDLEMQEVSLVPEAAHLLMAAALATAPRDAMPEHDGFRLGRLPGGPHVLQFRFGDHNWLSIVLQPEDLLVLQTALRAR